MTQYRQFGPCEQAASKLLQFAIDNNVPGTEKFVLDGQLGAQWRDAFSRILSDCVLRHKFDYGVLREVRDDLIPVFGRFSFVGDIGQSFPGHFEFLKMIDARAREEAEGKPPTRVRVLFARACRWPDHWA